LDSVEGVVNGGLCTGCGTCAGVCPADAISMHVLDGLFLPVVDENRCNMCGLCVKCCPGYSMDFEALNSVIFGEQPENVLIGNYLGCYVGHSRDFNTRFASSSGGIVTQLLIFALEKGIIDGAIVTRMDEKNPFQPKSFVAKTREEIISASRSKYCPTSVNERLKCVLEEDGRFAVVGLPCQIHGTRKAEINVKGLSEKIVLHIGLICSHTVDFRGTEHILRKLGIPIRDVAEIAYRGCGWPGKMTIRLTDGSELSIPYTRKFNAYWPVFSCFYYTPRRCLMCPDLTNELADISVGDAWLPEFRKDKVGRSIVISRTRLGENLLNTALIDDVISLEPVNVDAVLKSQRDSLKFKKVDFAVRLGMMKSLGAKTPSFSLSKPFSSSFFSFIRNLFVVTNVKTCEHKFFRNTLIGVPFPLFRLYSGVYRLLCLF